VPEYLAPGVFVEEVSFRSRTIEGVPTSTTGFVGMARYGPVHYVMADGVTYGPRPTDARLVTSFADYEDAYGGLEPLQTGDQGERVCYVAHAVRAFFLNGGSVLYISRVFRPNSAADNGVAYQAVSVGAGTATWRARWPGAYGNALVSVAPKRTKNVAVTDSGGNVTAQGAVNGGLAEIYTAPPATPVTDATPLDVTKLAVVHVAQDGTQTFYGQGDVLTTPPAGAQIYLVDMSVTVQAGTDPSVVYTGVGVHPAHRRYIGRILDKDEPADENCVVWLDWTAPGQAAADLAPELAVALAGNPNPRLAHGNDGVTVTADDILGEDADPDDALKKATGLYALGEIDDIAIVAAPDGGSLDGPGLPPTEALAAAGALIAHAELLRYRIAIIDAPPDQSITEIREFRGQFDSTRAALYHPWVVILDPLQAPTAGTPPPTLTLPPSGFVAGIYGRSDANRGVFKAPANEVVQGLTRLEANINTGRQMVLNPEGINALRFFEGGGNKVWGARTVSSDPEWIYVNVRRLFIYLEHSIDNSMQWAVFEPNDQRLWDSIRTSVEDFLFTEWAAGGLLGSKPEEAYFVRCDRTTMTQNDLDNGRLICLIGVAPVKPAEFVIFRIGQWTADATVS
jgi:uncharacterized protein